MLDHDGTRQRKTQDIDEIRSRRKNIGSENEHINDNPAYENSHFITDEGRRVLDEHEIIDDDECEHTHTDDTPTAKTPTRSTPVETVDEGEKDDSIPGEDEDSVDSDTPEDDDPMLEDVLTDDPGLDDSFELYKIVDHRFHCNTLLLKAIFTTKTDNELTLEVPMRIMKKEHPVDTARYIRMYVTEDKRKVLSSSGQVKSSPPINVV